MDLVILLLAGRTANSYGMASAAGLTEPGNHKWKVMQVVSPIYSKGIKPEAYVRVKFSETSFFLIARSNLLTSRYY